MFPFKMDDLSEDILKINKKMLEGIEALSKYRETDIQVGQSPREAVYTEDKMTLWHFPPTKPDVLSTPLIIVYSLVNRPFLADLQPGRSLVENLLNQGIDVYLVDFGYPDRNDLWLTLDDYINFYIDSCVDVVRKRHGLDKINLMGICQGGTFCLIYTALHQEKLKNYVTMVTPVDFHVDGSLLNIWAGCTPGPQTQVNFDTVLQAMGNVPGDFINYGFLMQSPFQLTVAKYLNLLDMVGDEDMLLNFLHMEKWIFDSPDQAGTAYHEFMTDFYQGNKLAKGEYRLNNQPVSLKNITIPVLNIYAEKDHLVPPPSAIALGDLVGTKDYTVRSFPVGHIGMYVSRKTQEGLAPTIAEWLKARA